MNQVRSFIPGFSPYRGGGGGSHRDRDRESEDMTQQEQKRRRKAERKRQKRRAKIPLVTIHGIKGSVLVDAKDNIVWLTGAQAAGLSTPDLSLPKKWKNGVQSYDGIRPKHTLKAVTVIPYLVGASLYEEWLQRSQTLGCPSYEFCYDWRRSNCESVIKFASYLRWISAKYNGVKVQVIAHSMGGNIAFAALNLYPELFHSLMCCGTPFRGGPAFFPDMHIGMATGRNWDILTPSVISFFPSMHSISHLFGEHDDATYSGCVDKDMKPIPIDWHNINDWKKYKAGLFANSEPLSEADEAAFECCLNDAKKFRSLLKYRADVNYPPLFIFGSNTAPTPKYVMKDGPKSIRGWDFDTCPKHPGDGRVPFSHILPSDQLSYEVFLTEYQHDVLLSDPRIPSLLQKLVDQVADTNQSIYNPYHSRL